MRTVTHVGIRIIGFILLTAFVVSCGDDQIRASKHWMPQSVGGPIKVRPLPPANAIEEYYREWVTSQGDRKVRLFEVVLNKPSDQAGFATSHGRSETPMGRQTTTFVSFTYSSPTNGSYYLEWMAHGKQNPDWVRVGQHPKKFLLRLLQTRDVVMPRLQIVAIEGVGRRGVVIASTNLSSL